MTDSMTSDEIEYYIEKWERSKQIVNAAFPGREDIPLPFYGFQFEKIASPLYFLRQENPLPPIAEQAPQRENPIELGQTQFKQAEKPNPHGMIEYTYATNVQRDLRTVLNKLGVAGEKMLEHQGFVYELSHFNKKDYLWRKQA